MEGLQHTSSANGNSLEFFLAACTGNSSLVAELLEQGVDVDFQIKGKKWNSLIAASKNGRLTVVTTLLEADADVNNVSTDGHSALYYAYSGSGNSSPDEDTYVPIMKLLIKYGAEVESETFLQEDANSNPSREARDVIANWRQYTPTYKNGSPDNRLLRKECKDIAMSWFLCCKRLKVFPKDLIHLILEYVCKDWQNTKETWTQESGPTLEDRRLAPNIGSHRKRDQL